MPVINTGITEGDLLAELSAQLIREGDIRRPGDITADDLMVQTGMSRERVREFLRRQVRAGLLEERWIVDGGGRKKAYRRKV